MKMKPNTFILFYAIFVLFLSLISSSVNDSPNTENYIVLTYVQETQLKGQFINASNSSIDKIIIGNATYNGFGTYTAPKNTNVEVHFKEALSSLASFFPISSPYIMIGSADFSHFDSSPVTDMRNMFEGCMSLKSLNLLNLDTSLVIDMNYMFQGCSNLPNVSISHFNTSLVRNMSNMFNNCGRLTSLNISNFVTSSVTNMSHMFESCDKLQNLDLSKFNTSSVTDMRYMFSENYLKT